MKKNIEVHNLSAGYEQKVVLEDVSFDVFEGELLGIIGPNGSGKSTIMKTLRGILPKLAGEVKINGENIDELGDKEFAKAVAYLQQNVNFTFAYTGREIVKAGRYPYLEWWQHEGSADEQLIELCMEYTGVSDLAEVAITNVSGGQKQRVLLAKVLCQQTPILFLDEPTTGLDIVYQEEIFRFCQALCKAGKTVVMVAHELGLAYKYCSRVILIADKKILADGTPQAVITSKNLSVAYKIKVAVCEDAQQGNIDITVENDENIIARQQEIEAIICRQ